MDYYVIYGMVVASIIAIFGFVVSIKNETKKEQDIFARLEMSITKLNSTIDNLSAENIKRDKRIEKHGEQIDDIDHRLVVMETRQQDSDYNRKKVG